MFINNNLIYFNLTSFFLLYFYNFGFNHYFIWVLIILLKYNIFNFNKMIISNYYIFFLNLLDSKVFIFLLLNFLYFFLKIQFIKINNLIQIFIVIYILVNFLNNNYLKLIEYKTLNNTIFNNNDYSSELINGLFFLHPLFFFWSIFLVFISFILKFNINFNIINKWLYKNNYINNFYLYTFNKDKNFFIIICFSLISGSWWAQQELNWNGWWSWDNIELIVFLEFMLLLINLHLIIYQKKKNLIVNFVIYIALSFFLVLRFNLMITRHTFLVDVNNLQFSIYGLFIICILTVLFFFLININSTIKIIYKNGFFNINTINFFLSKKKIYNLLLLNKYIILYLLIFIFIFLYYITSVFLGYIINYLYLIKFIKFDFKGIYYLVIIFILLQSFFYLNQFFFKKNRYTLNFFFIFFNINKFNNWTINKNLNLLLNKLHLINYFSFFYFLLIFNNISFIPLFILNFSFYEDFNLNFLNFFFKKSQFYLNIHYNYDILKFNIFWDNWIDLNLLLNDVIGNQNINNIIDSFNHNSAYNQLYCYINVVNSAGINIILVDLFFIYLIFLCFLIIIFLILIL